MRVPKIPDESLENERKDETRRVDLGILKNLNLINYKFVFSLLRLSLHYFLLLRRV